MALQRVLPGAHPVLFVFLITVVAVLAMAALTAILGVQGPGPSLDIIPDPAAPALPF